MVDGPYDIYLPVIWNITFESHKCSHILIRRQCKKINTLRLRQQGRHFPDDISKCIFLNENVWILIMISLIFVPKGPINYIPALYQIMACPRPGDKPLSEPLMVIILTNLCVTKPQWVNNIGFFSITWISTSMWCSSCYTIQYHKKYHINFPNKTLSRCLHNEI